MFAREPFFLVVSLSNTQAPRGNLYDKVGDDTVGLSAELTGWALVEKLYSIGLDNPGELARFLEEEDPFKVKTERRWHHGIIRLALPTISNRTYLSTVYWHYFVCMHSSTESRSEGAHRTLFAEPR